MVSAALLFAVITFTLWGRSNFLMGYAEENYDMDPRFFAAIMRMTMGLLGILLFAYLRLTGQGLEFDGKLVLPLVCGALLAWAYSFQLRNVPERHGDRRDCDGGDVERCLHGRSCPLLPEGGPLPAAVGRDRIGHARQGPAQGLERLPLPDLLSVLYHE